jgi:hypothetical protein
MACPRHRPPVNRKNIVNCEDIVETTASPFFPYHVPLPASLPVFWQSPANAEAHALDVTACSFQREVMERLSVFIKLKTGQNRVESLLRVRRIGHFCGHFWTLLIGIAELTGR